MTASSLNKPGDPNREASVGRPHFTHQMWLNCWRSGKKSAENFEQIELASWQPVLNGHIFVLLNGNIALSVRLNTFDWILCLQHAYSVTQFFLSQRRKYVNACLTLFPAQLWNKARYLKCTNCAITYAKPTGRLVKSEKKRWIETKVPETKFSVLLWLFNYHICVCVCFF